MAARLGVTAIMATWAATRYFSASSNGPRMRGSQVSGAGLGADEVYLSSIETDNTLDNLRDLVMYTGLTRGYSPAISYASGPAWYVIATPASRGFPSNTDRQDSFTGTVGSSMQSGQLAGGYRSRSPSFTSFVAQLQAESSMKGSDYSGVRGSAFSYSSQSTAIGMLRDMVADLDAALVPAWSAFQEPSPGLVPDHRGFGPSKERSFSDEGTQYNTVPHASAWATLEAAATGTPMRATVGQPGASAQDSVTGGQPDPILAEEDEDDEEYEYEEEHEEEEAPKGPAPAPVAVDPLAGLASASSTDAHTAAEATSQREREAGQEAGAGTLSELTPRGSSMAAQLSQWTFGDPSKETIACLRRVEKKYDCDAVGCDDQVQGFVNYLATHECTMGEVNLKWLSWICMIVWLVYLLFMLGDTADEFFCPVLDQIVIVTHISPNLAGVTFLSLGNGAPDAAASIAATLSGQLDVGVSAVIGAGVFVTTVVIAAVILSSEVTLNRRPFLRDTIFYLVATLYLLVCFSDKKVHLGEALGFLGIYVVFGSVVVVGRQLYQGWKGKEAEEQGDLLDSGAAGGKGAGAMVAPAGGKVLTAGPGPSPLGTSRRSLLGDGPASGSGRAGAGGGRSRAFSDEWMASERKTEVAARLHDVMEEDGDEENGGAEGGEQGQGQGQAGVPSSGPGAAAAAPGAAGRSPSAVRRHASWKDATNSAMRSSARSLVMGKKRRSLLPGDKVFAEAAKEAKTEGETEGEAGAASARSGLPPSLRDGGGAGAPMRLRSGSLVERGDGSGVHGAVAAAISGRRKRGRSHKHAKHGKDGYHKPAGFFHTHERRARMWMRFVVDEEKSIHSARERAAKGHQSGGGVKGSLNVEHSDVASDRQSDQGPAQYDESGVPLLPSSDGEGDGSDDDGEEEEADMCDAFCGDDTLLGKALNTILFPSNLLRQITVPMLDEDSYDYRFVAATTFFGLPFMAVVGYQTIGADLSGLTGPILPGAPAGVCVLLVLGLVGLTKSVAMWFTLPRDEIPQSLFIVIPLLFLGFLTSVCWIIVIANEIVGLLEALGLLLSVPTSVLGLTVLAWGNSLGDLIADMTVAKEGKPEMAIAGAIAGPGFNLAIGLGLSLVIGVSNRVAQHATDPTIPPYIDLTNPDNTTPLPPSYIRVVWTLFGFLILSLVSMLVIVPLSSDSSTGKYTMPRWLAYYQLACYAVFMVLAFTFTFAEF